MEMAFLGAPSKTPRLATASSALYREDQPSCPSSVQFGLRVRPDPRPLYYESSSGIQCRGSTYRLRGVCLGFWVPGSTALGSVETKARHERIAGGAEADKKNSARGQAPGTFNTIVIRCCQCASQVVIRNATGQCIFSWNLYY
jgi:hypothetical protein